MSTEKTGETTTAEATRPLPRLLTRANFAPLALVNLGVGLHAVIWYLASTAMPTAIGDVGGAEYLSWTGSLYLVTTILGGAVTAILKGRYGARDAMLGAGIVVVIGGAVQAVAPGIALILVGRAIQGLGEGVLIALSYVLTRELFDNRLVPRVFGTLAATWGGAVFLGPLIGGVLTELFSWRIAFVGSALLPLPMMALAWAILRERPQRSFHGRPPLLRVGLLAAGVIAIAAADRLGSAVAGVLAVAAGILAVAFALKLDRRSATHLITTVFPGLRHRVSWGLWILTLMPLAEAGVFVYTPYILQLERGLTPTWAGYFGAIHAVTWSLAAVAVAQARDTWHGRFILAGPALLALGLAIVAVTMASQPLILVGIGLALIGIGFGISHSFINQRLMAAAPDGQGDATATAIPTLECLGAAIGAALAGLAGNAAGLAGPLDTGVVAEGSLLVFGGGALFSLLAVLMAIGFLRSRQPAEAAVLA
ncbi:MFS transporter [Dongia mobilis]|uniref:MFS transporter n=1 Tax=Dongia mobilis TaxID=578943 RepID=A0A4R6WKD9_9PROT|nr:MFS transporter [Dongia mobilis]TDQ81023.1 MFS transporter [Dongia mobilis]